MRHCQMGERKKELEDWLALHVIKFPEPVVVTLSNFGVNWEKFSGEFELDLDATRVLRKLKFGLEASGKTTFYLPMFHSPLGVPASYPAFAFTERTERAILKGLRETFPRVRGAGIDLLTGREIWASAPVEQRIERSVVEMAKKKVTRDYEISVQVHEL